MAKTKMRKAKRTEIAKWFDDHPEHQRMILEDFRSLGRPVTGFEFVANFTDYLIDSEVGLVPTYALEDLDLRDAEWGDAFGLVDFDIGIFKVLWFGVRFVYREDEEPEVSVFPLEQLAQQIKNAEIEIYEYWNEPSESDDEDDPDIP